MNTRPIAVEGTLNSVWCDECGGYLLVDVSAARAQAYADRHMRNDEHDVWIDAN